MSEPFRITPLMIRFGTTSENRWSFPNLLDDGNIHAARTMHRYETRSGNEDLVASAMIDSLYYLVIECPTTQLACENLRKIRAAHKWIANNGGV